jgi:hypothetical protein
MNAAEEEHGAWKIPEADRHGYALAKAKFIADGYAQPTPKELGGIDRCRQGFEAMGPPPEVIFLPGPIAGSLEAHVLTAAERHARFARETRAMAAAWSTLATDFIGPRRRGCIQRDENGGLVMDLEGALTAWPAGEREAAERREAPAAPAAGGV